MEDHQKILDALLKAERRARSSRYGRFLHAPVTYPLLMGFSYLMYPTFKRGLFVKAKTFFGVSIKTLLPSGTDIVLNRIKSHDSEIRLAKFLTLQLKDGDCFIDVGAHYGYYTLLGSVLVGDRGHVYAVEASASSFEILKTNTTGIKNITLYHQAAGDTPGEMVFYEYPGPYAEYNTTIEGAYVNQPWIKKIKQTINRVNTIVLDALIREKGIIKAFIKIDTEGGELSVIRGLIQSLQSSDLTIIMEYLRSSQPASLHKQAVALLLSNGYHAHAIDIDGQIKPVSDVDQYLMQAGLDSDNLVFRKN